MAGLIAALMVLGAIGAREAVAAPGDLDPTFNPSGDPPGTVTTAPKGFNFSVASGVALQNDGKIVAAGYAGNNPGGGEFALARYNSDGSLDSSFGTNGTVVTDIGTDGSQASGVVLQPDGKIVAAGFAEDGPGDRSFALARYNPNGSLDTTFNPTGSTPGTVTTDVGESGNSVAGGVALQPDGKIVAAGFAADSSGGGEFALARYNPNGSLDTTFGTNGTVVTDVGSEGSQIDGVALQPDGKIVAAGFTGDGRSSNEFALARYNPNGSLDPTFNPTGATPGIVTTSVGGSGDSQAKSVALQPDGKIIAAGYARDGSGDQEFALARYDPNGSLDSGFGNDGLAITDVGSGDSVAFDVALQPDGKIVDVGETGGNSAPQEFALARYNPNGSLDGSFGNNGLVTTNVGGSGLSFAFAVALQPDGKIVVAGFAGEGFGTKFALARYEGRSAPPPAAKANLSLTKKASKSRPTVGQKLTYTLRLKNNGPARATNTKIVDTLPRGVKVTSSSRGCKKQSARKVVCNIGALADGKSVAKKIRVKVNRSGKLVNRARASSSARDPNPRNNRARAVVRAKAKQISCRVKNPTLSLKQGNQVVIVDTKAGKNVACVVQGNQLALARTLKNQPLRIVRQGGKQVRAAKGKVVKTGARKVVVRVPKGF
ncbi:MAG: hypothetical protein ACFB50_08705 [Rubrobacteraceae bacterium]